MNEPKCPHHLRTDLPPLTDRIAALLIDERGYPVPRFVQWLENDSTGKPHPAPYGTGYPEFRMASATYLRECVQFNLCWVCGERLGVHRAFVIGPMCAINFISAEPPSHIECAEWSVRGCPFLSRPQMKRRDDDFLRIHGRASPGHIDRNPQVTLIWHVRSPAKLLNDGAGSMLFQIPSPPISLRFFKEGRIAMPAEILHAIDSGIPTLLEQCRNDRDRKEVSDRRDKMVKALNLTLS